MNSVRAYSPLRTSKSLRHIAEGAMRDRTILILACLRVRSDYSKAGIASNGDDVGMLGLAVAHQPLQRGCRADVFLNVADQVGRDLAHYLLDGGIQDVAFAVEYFLHVRDRRGGGQSEAADMRDDPARMFQRLDGADRAGSHTEQCDWFAGQHGRES